MFSRTDSKICGPGESQRTVFRESERSDQIEQNTGDLLKLVVDADCHRRRLIVESAAARGMHDQLPTASRPFGFCRATTLDQRSPPSARSCSSPRSCSLKSRAIPRS